MLTEQSLKAALECNTPITMVLGTEEIQELAETLQRGREAFQRANETEAKLVALTTAFAPLVASWRAASDRAIATNAPIRLQLNVNLLASALTVADTPGVGQAFVTKLQLLIDALSHIALNSTDAEARTVASAALADYNVRLESVAVPQQSNLIV